ncbi:glycoside hydrolase family 18 protein [Oidiodendron maius Zn]|uniref:Glycoside hydrolase family 18 protein n=1 Tax=Oidiodendron maius (strain Zn) TaxID=913774 RepID=A0A0C3D8Z5_OIDMZ|nr:glycoside hydrolase family 18 protein [Oidiodendron maius Zn]
MKTSFLTSLAFSAAVVSAGIIKQRASAGLNVVYWGQDDSEKSLGAYCASGQGIDVIVLAFLSTFGNGNTPSGDFGNECDVASNGDGSCNTLAKDITTCKGKGIKVLISAGGWGANYDLSSKNDADGVAWSLWNEWAAPGAVSSSAPRPIGNTYVDGWDFDVEANPNNSGQYLGELVTKLRSYFASDPSNKYYISGAPQCPLPEANMGAAIKSSQFDWLFIQFYNNDECSAYQLFQNDGGSFNYDSWVSYVAGTPSAGAKLFVGLPASKDASTGDSSGSKYYVSPANLVSLVSKYKSHAQFGGIMLWDAGNSDTVNVNGCNYAQEVHSVLNTGAAC